MNVNATEHAYVILDSVDQTVNANPVLAIAMEELATVMEHVPA